MKTTRRGLFGILAGAAAGTAVVKVLPAAEPLALQYIEKDATVAAPVMEAVAALSPNEKWVPVIVDAGGKPLRPEHFRQLLNWLHQKGGYEARPDEWGIHPETRKWFEEWMREEPAITRIEHGRGVPDLLSLGQVMISGIPLVDNTWAGPAARSVVYASRGEHFKDAVLLGKIVNLGDGRCAAERLHVHPDGSTEVRCEKYAGHTGLHETVIALPGRRFEPDGLSLGRGSGTAYQSFRWKA